MGTAEVLAGCGATPFFCDRIELELATSHLPSTESLDCPRCGYDLRGNVALWEECGECPLIGKCSECGLDFEWTRVFREAEHPWLFEYHWRRKPFSSFWKTLWRSVLPWKFWREVDLFWAVRIGPLFTMVIICQLASAGMCFAILLWNNFQWMIGRMSRGGFGYTKIQVVQASLSELVSWMAHSHLLWAAVTWSVGIPLAFCLLPMSLQRAKVRPTHLVRVFCYSVLMIMPMILFGSLLVGAYYYEWDRFIKTMAAIARFTGAGVGWFLRDILHIRGISHEEDAMFAFPLLLGVFFIPYWWFAIKNYLKIEVPARVLAALSIITMILVIVSAMLIS